MRPLGGPTVRALIVLLALAPAATVSAYRTSADSDDPELRGQEPARWRDPVIHFRLHDALPEGLDRAAVEAEARAAFEAWTLPSCTSLRVVFDGWTDLAADPSDGVVTVQFVFADWAAYGSPSTPGTTDVRIERDDESTSFFVKDADVFLNAEGFTWSTAGSGGAIDLRAALTHEVAHCLPLWHAPCELEATEFTPDCSGFEPAGILWPEYRGERAIDADAVAGLCTLYPALECAETCGPGTICRDGACVDPCADGSCGHPGAFGDPCERASECLSALCSAEGFCTTACSERSPCSGELTCTAPPGETGECVASGSRYGESCVMGEDCASGLCLEGATPQPVCTRACDGAGACPIGDVCDRVDGRLVCHPPVHQSSGCAAAGAARPSWIASALLAALLLVRTASRRRDS